MFATPLLPASGPAHKASRRPGRTSDKCTLVRLVLPALVITVFLLFVLTASILDETGPLSWKHPAVVFPDFSHYNDVFQTLPQSLFPAHPDDDKRIVAVGDIHSMNQSLSALLAKISFNPQSDTLIHLGDIVPKSQDVSSDPLLSFVSTSNILGVRGNNDQTVIEWRSWMDWIISLPGGKEWLKDVDSHWSHINSDEHNAEFNAWLKKSHRKWQEYVPSGWKLLDQQYRVARDMSQRHYKYLRSLPLVLYAPAAHTYFVHAGLLAADPTRKVGDPKQPLSHWPTTTDPEADGLILRGLQEIALLNEIPQNRDPWTLMNMRSVKKGGKVTEKGKKGTPWTELWNGVMDSCSGLSTDPFQRSSRKKTRLHCFPSMVIYGHAAARDLDVKRWSVGLDTGCAYGRQLTAVVLGAKSLFLQAGSISPPLKDSYIPYGDEGTAQITSVKCPF